MTDIETSRFDKFIGKRRFQELFTALRRESAQGPAAELDTIAVLAALVVSFGPALILYRDSLNPIPQPQFPVLAVGICTLLAMFLRSRFKLEHRSVASWKESFGLMHTAFALGCIPTVIILILEPNLLLNRQDLISRAASGPVEVVSYTTAMIRMVVFTIVVALWAAITEEYIFRGLLISAVRRWKWVKNQRSRDILAVSLSAIAFGGAHFAAWGPYSALALVGLGAGFSLGYIANGEKIMPCILYHMLFDIFSITFSILVR